MIIHTLLVYLSLKEPQFNASARPLSSENKMQPQISGIILLMVFNLICYVGHPVLPKDATAFSSFRMPLKKVAFRALKETDN